MIGWNRLLAGRVSDPMVGRELLIGGLAGTGTALLVQVHALASNRFGHEPTALLGIREDLLGHGPAVVAIASLAALYAAMGIFFMMAILIVILRRADRGFAAAFCVIAFMSWAGAQTAGASVSPGSVLAPSVAVAIASTAILFVALLRFGLLAYVSTIVFSSLLDFAPLTTDLSAWYWFSNVAVWLTLVGVTVYGFVASIGGRRQFLRTVLGEN
jgi:hypothetical protein